MSSEPTTTWKFCIDCGQRLAESDRFCPRCGMVVPPRTSPPDPANPPSADNPADASGSSSLRLKAAVDLYVEELYRQDRRDLVRPLEWYRSQAQRQGSVRFGEVDVPAVKVRGAWYVDATALAVAIEHARHSRRSVENGGSEEGETGESEEYSGMMRYTFLSVERLISGLPAYLDVVGEIARGPFAFARKLDWTDPDELDRATNYLIFSVIVTLFLAIGASLLAKVIYGDSGHGIPKLQYMVDTLVPFALFGAIIHSALWLLGVRRPGSFKTTMTVYAYLFGTTQPLTYLLLFPVVVPIGPELMLGGAESSPRTQQVFASAPGLAIYAILALIVVAGLGMTLLVSWLASAHHVSKKRVALALAMALLPFSALYTVVQVVLDFLAPGLEWLDAVL